MDLIKGHGLHCWDVKCYPVQRIFCVWIIFLATLFNEIDFKPPSKYTLKKMPEISVETGHGLTNLVID